MAEDTPKTDAGEPGKPERPPKGAKPDGAAPKGGKPGKGERPEGAHKPTGDAPAAGGGGQGGGKPPREGGKPGKDGGKGGKDGGKGGKGGGKGGKDAGPARPKAPEVPDTPAPPPRFLVKYRQEIVGRLMQSLGTANRNAIPRVTKVVLSMGVGEAKQNKKRLEHAVRDLGLIAGQRPVVTKARVSVAGFHLRQGMDIGCKVTLRGKRMYEFLDRLVSVAIPRIRDFRGLNPKSFDGNGAYNMGLTEQLLFPEVTVDSVEFPQGLNVTIVTTAAGDDAARTLLAEMGFPFRTT